MRVAVVQRILPPYRLGPLGRISELLRQEAPGSSLTVFHGDPGVPSGRVSNSFFERHDENHYGPGGLVFRRGLLSELPGRFDVVVCEFGLRLAFAPALMAACRRRGTAFVWWGSGWEEWHEAGPGGLRALRRIWRAHLARSADGIICYGHRAQRFYGRLGVPLERTAVAVNSLDTGTIELERRRSEDRWGDRDHAKSARGFSGSSLFLFVGRLLDYKRADLFIDAVAACGSGDVRGVVIGDGPDRARLERLAKKNAPGRIHFEGAVHERGPMADWFRAADALVLPGQAGLAVNDALAHGVPVIAGSEAGPELEALEDGVNGLVVSDPKAESLARAMLRIRDDGEFRRRAENNRGPRMDDMARGFVSGVLRLGPKGLGRSEPTCAGSPPPGSEETGELMTTDRASQPARQGVA